MEENVAIHKENEKTFRNKVKSIKKKLSKKEEAQTKPDDIKSESTQPSVDAPLGPINKKQGKKRSTRGLVYISHIPHGFYENEMTKYFKQFGLVTNARVIRSKKTGQSKGCAFVEFKDTGVAKVVAETMNNYLMGKRLLKAAYIPPSKQRPNAMRKKWNEFNNPSSNLRRKLNKSYNEDGTDESNLKVAKHLLKKLNLTKKKLKAHGINYDFFVPVDVPGELQEAVKNSVENKPAPVTPKQKVTEEKKTNNKKKAVASSSDEDSSSSDEDVKFGELLLAQKIKDSKTKNFNKRVNRKKKKLPLSRLAK